MLQFQNKKAVLEAREPLSSVGLISPSIVGLVHWVQPVGVVLPWKMHLGPCNTVCLKQTKQSQVLKYMLELTREVNNAITITITWGNKMCPSLCSKLGFPLLHHTEHQEIKIIKKYSKYGHVK